MLHANKKQSILASTTNLKVRPNKKKKRSNHRGQKAKNEYQLRKKEKRSCNDPQYDSDDSFIRAQNDFVMEAEVNAPNVRNSFPQAINLSDNA